MASHIEIWGVNPKFFPSSPIKDILSCVELTKLGDTIGSLKHPYAEKKKQKQTYLDNLDKKPKKYFYSGF